jgi:uncharacterized protein
MVCERCSLADSFVRRLRGLLGRRELPRGEGMLLSPSSTVHTSFMRFPIDAVFLNRDFDVVGIAANLRPWRFAGRAGARSVLELPAGESARRGLRVGERLSFVEPSGSTA